MDIQTRYCYLKSGDGELFTAILIPEKSGKHPSVLIRNPYVNDIRFLSEEEILEKYKKEYKEWIKNGYAVVIQHCRGHGKSSGDSLPYINEREDGLLLQDWVRNQDFYNGELYLWGQSYLASVHYATAPFANDIKGAVFRVQDTERYNICYRNGFFKKALHGNWCIGMYHVKAKTKKNYSISCYDMLPLSDFTKTVFGKPQPDLDGILSHPNRSDDFWNTRYGGNDARGAVRNANFPILFETGFYDIYTGGMFEQWNDMNPESRAISALVVSAYDHGDTTSPENIVFPNGKREEQFGTDYEIKWFNAIRTGGQYPFKRGKVTYYRLFENRWGTDEFYTALSEKTIILGNGEMTYLYNPFDPPSFRGGLSNNFGGAQFQDPPNRRYDIITLYSDFFEKDSFIKGKMSAKLTVKTNCEDTCFYIRISLCKSEGDYGLRDDITSVCYQHSNYIPGSKVELTFSFDEHAFLIKKGERLRIDISSADNAHFVRHTNQKGLFSEQRTAKPALNTVYCKESFLTLPIDHK